MRTVLVAVALALMLLADRQPRGEVTMPRDNRTYNQKLEDRHGGKTVVPEKVNDARQRDAKHQGAAKK